MITFTPRRFKFKAWNQESRLLMKLSSIECVKGELYKKDHLLLQFTGHQDKHQEEIYEMDVVLLSSEKFVVTWDEDTNGWFLWDINRNSRVQQFAKEVAEKSVRLCSYFELSP